MICGLSHIFLTIKLESLAPGMKCLQKTRKSTKFKTLTPCSSSIFKIFDINCLLAQRHSTGEFEGERFSMISTSNGKITKIAPLMLFNLKKTSQAKRRLSQCSCSFFFCASALSQLYNNIMRRRARNIERNPVPAIPKNRPVACYSERTPPRE